MTKESIIEHANAKALATILAEKWTTLMDEDAQEECLETVYDALAKTAPKPDNFSLLSNEAKAQYEVDVDMLLITIDYCDFETKIFDGNTIESFFWDHVSCKDKKINDKIYKVVFV